MTRIVDLKNREPEKPVQENKKSFSIIDLIVGRNEPLQEQPVVKKVAKQKVLPLDFSASHVSWQTYLTTPFSGRQLGLLTGVLLVTGASSWFLGYNIFLLAFLGVATAFIFLHQNSEHSPTEVVAHDNGVTVGARTVEYRELRSFWIEYNPAGIKELSLRQKHWYLPYLKIPLGEQDPVPVYVYLTRYLPEEEQEASLIDIVFKK